MTSEEFESRYQILKQAAAGSVRSYLAMGHTRAVVMVHVLDGDPVGVKDLLGRVDTLAHEQRSRIIETVEVNGTPVLVTRFIFDFTSLEAWLREHVAARGPVPPAASI